MAYTGDGDDYLTASSSPVTAVPLTMACWVRLDTVDINQGLVALYGDANNYWKLTITSANALRFGARDTGTSVTNATSAGTVSSGTWVHAAGVAAAVDSRIAYLDGTASTANTNTRTPASVANMRIMGIEVGTSQRLVGAIAEVGIWAAALSTADITSLAKGFTPPLVRPDALVSYVPLVRNAIDWVGGIALTETGTTIVSPHPRIYR